MPARRKNPPQPSARDTFLAHFPSDTEKLDALLVDVRDYRARHPDATAQQTVNAGMRFAMQMYCLANDARQAGMLHQILAEAARE